MFNQKYRWACNQYATNKQWWPNFCIDLQKERLGEAPQWGAAGAEIKVPYVEKTELKGSRFKA